MMSPMEALKLARKRSEEEGLATVVPCQRYYASSVLHAISAATSLDAETCDRWAEDEERYADAYRKARDERKAAECFYAACVLRGLAHDIREG